MKKTFLLIGAFFIVLIVNCQEDTIFLSTPYNYTDWIGKGDLYSIASLNSSKFIVAYDKGGVWEGKVRVGDIVKDSTIVYGNEFTYSVEMSLNGVEIDALSSTEFLITYRDNYSLKIRKGKIDGNNITLYSPYTYLNSYCYTFSVAVISASEFVISYLDPQNDYGKTALGKISNNLISINSAYTFSTSTIENYAEMTVDTLTKSRFVVTYGYWGGCAVIGNINQVDEISFGNVYAYNALSTDAYYPKVISINENQFVIGYINDYNLENGTLIIGNVSNQNEITYGPKFICSPEHTSNISITKLTNDKIIIAYGLFDNTNRSFVNSAKINNNTFQLNNAIVNDSISGYNVVNKLDTSNFILIYYNLVNYNGISKIGSTNKFEGSSIFDNFKELNISVYPNPTSQIVIINLESNNQKTEIQLVNMTGQILYKEFTNNSRITLNIGNLNNGIYLMNIITKKHIITKKIIKI